MKTTREQLKAIMSQNKELLKTEIYQELILGKHLMENEGLPYDSAKFIVEWLGKAESIKRQIRLIQEKSPELRDIRWIERQRKKLEYVEKKLK